MKIEPQKGGILQLRTVLSNSLNSTLLHKMITGDLLEYVSNH